MRCCVVHSNDLISYCLETDSFLCTSLTTGNSVNSIKMQH